MAVVVVGNKDGGAVSVVELLVSLTLATTVSVAGGSCAVEPIGISVCCRGGSVVLLKVEGNSFGIEFVAVSLCDVTGEGLSVADFCATGASIFGAGEVSSSTAGNA